MDSLFSDGTHARRPDTPRGRQAGLVPEHRLRLKKTERTGIAQLTLVEHALCALDPTVSLQSNYHHETGFFYSEEKGNRRFANVSVTAPLGLSSRDEFFLWGLLALTLNQPQPSIEFLATPHYCLRKLGALPERWGGKNYANFRATIKRLAGIFYQCDAFYDPKLQTFQDVGFGFLKYSLPQKDDSSRAWRIVWDPLFFEYAQATGGKLFFDLTSKAFRDLDPAARRLALLLHKVFWRHKQSPPYELRHLAVHVLGFAPGRLTKYLKRDIESCAERLLAAGFIRLPVGVSDVGALFEKRGKGNYSIRFQRGSYFEQTSVDRVANQPRTDLADSPLYDPLKSIGFEDGAIRAIVRNYDHQTIARWAQYTQAALETKGERFFRKSPQAYCLDGIKRGSSAPDWFLAQQRDDARSRQDAEFRRLRSSSDDDNRVHAYRSAKSAARSRYIQEHVTREHYKQTVETFLQMFAPGMPSNAAREHAIASAEEHLTAGFRFPSYEEWPHAEYEQPR